MHDESDYYQILQVQPDASVAAIRQNYRLLLNKLRIHPDLGGSQKQAILVNAAYETLVNPEKRAAYNHRLSTRGLYPFLPIFPRKTTPSSVRTWKKNRRNYYRILQLHPEAHAEIIRARYRTMVDETDPPHDLLHEAFGLLNNPRERARYDRLLKQYNHTAVLEIMQVGPDEQEIFPDTRLPVPAGPETRKELEERLNGLSPVPITARGYGYGYGYYRRHITRCCAFCGNSYTTGPENDDDPICLCPVCSSPSAAVGEEMFGESSRRFERRKKSETIHFYPGWPGQKEIGRLFDISPSGLRFKSEIRLKTGQIIKIESRQFKAVAEVVHCREEESGPSYGVRFRTVFFGAERGYFLSAMA